MNRVRIVTDGSWLDAARENGSRGGPKLQIIHLVIYDALGSRMVVTNIVEDFAGYHVAFDHRHGSRCVYIRKYLRIMRIMHSAGQLHLGKRSALPLKISCCFTADSRFFPRRIRSIEEFVRRSSV
jgi:hypothetical protein